MMKILILITGFITALNFVSCSQTTQDKALENGKILPYVICKSDTLVSYALFLPANYTIEKSWPVVFCFDSHGNGTLPVKNFQKDADRLGYILVGSNNSKNGQSLDLNTSYYKTMLLDVRERLKVNDKRIYTCGFSGGARVASAIGLFEGGIKGVIGCGAGFAGVNKPPAYTFDYLAVGGNADFNLLELKSLMKNLEGSPYSHHLIVFDGIHEWPQNRTVEDIFNWMEIRAMKDGLVPNRPEFLTVLADDFKKRITTAKEIKDDYQAWLCCETAAHFFESTAIAGDFKVMADDLKKKPEVIQRREHLHQLSVTEEQLMKEYSGYIQTKDLTWWKPELVKIRRQGDLKDDPDKALMYKRLLSYLSLVAYMNASSVIQSGNWKLAENLVALYALIDPGNPEPEKMRRQIERQLKK